MSRAFIKEDVDLPKRSSWPQDCRRERPITSPRDGAKRLRDELQKLRAANANSERIIELRVIGKLKLSLRETYHGPPFERINSRTAFAAFSNGRAVAMIIIQNSTAS